MGPQGHVLLSPCVLRGSPPPSPSTQASGSLPLKYSTDPNQKTENIKMQGEMTCIILNNAPLFSPYIYRKDNLILARGNVRREDIELGVLLQLSAE